MTKREALTEARRRWGRSGFVKEARNPGYRYVVGKRGDPRIPLGMGDTWEAAFADADQREKEVSV